MITLSAAKQLLKSYQNAVGEEEFRTACRWAVFKITTPPDALSVENLTDEQLLNCIIAELQ